MQPSDFRPSEAKLFWQSLSWFTKAALCLTVATAVLSYSTTELGRAADHWTTPESVNAAIILNELSTLLNNLGFITNSTSLLCLLISIPLNTEKRRRKRLASAFYTAPQILLSAAEIAQALGETIEEREQELEEYDALARLRSAESAALLNDLERTAKGSSRATWIVGVGGIVATVVIGYLTLK